MVNLDKLIPELGGFGYYQKKLLLLLILPIASSSMFMIIMVFALYTPNHRCKPPHVQDSRGINASLEDQFVVSECNLQQIIEGPLNTTDAKLFNDSHHMIALPCREWDYDDDVFKETFTTTHNLVCDETVKISHAQMIFYFGVVIGDVLFGQLSDYIGRKKTLFITIFLLFIFGISASWSPEYYTFVIMQFVVGAACRGCSVLMFVTSLEFVGPSIRVWIGQYFNIFFALGLCALCGIGILIKDWQYIQIASSLPVVFLMSYWFFLDESPRWLLSKGRLEEAKTILQKIARVNNVTPDESLFEQLKCDEVIRTEKIWSLFTNRILAVRSLVVFFNWFAVGMTYYGVFLHAENLGGNFYLAIFLLSVIELPVLFLNLYLLNRFGRRRVHCFMMLMGGLACICTIFPVTFGGDGLQPLILALAVMGKMGASGAFGSIYVLSGELFPTVIRNGAVGVSSSFARIASMLAPYIAKLGTDDVGSFGKAIPLIIFGVCSIAAGLCSLYLPETMGCRLPDTIHDAVDFELLREDRNQDDEIAELETLNEKQS
ncbi:organic cation transporter protein-like [Mizuhopecten yessoensis]|uniref:Organic cation transporter protein n=1 Tax=Mizuhopecten yessoensis TaxID=6573 RepID=A0A210Q220_MIZYE|nr:organic cation transporter protein-like [Mizuhopecten yessoensis]OWF42777.1 Organic cation transporter protein [Mizuhopecten yessoensis]